MRSLRHQGLADGLNRLANSVWRLLFVWIQSCHSYIISTNKYNEDRFENKTLQLVILNLDQLVLTLDYYYLKAKELSRREAKLTNEKNAKNFLDKPKEYREEWYNQRNFYFSLPSKLKKTISEKEWEELTLEEKQELYLPIKKVGTKSQATIVNVRF